MKKVKKIHYKVVLRIKVIVNSLLVVGVLISEQDQIDSILDGLPKEYNLFVMQMYGSRFSLSLCDVEELLYVQEVHLDMF